MCCYNNNGTASSAQLHCILPLLLLLFPVSQLGWWKEREMNGEYTGESNVDECIICIYVSDWLFPSIFSTSLPVNSLLLSHSHLFPGGNSSLSVHIFQQRSTISYLSTHIIFTHSLSFFPAYVDRNRCIVQYSGMYMCNTHMCTLCTYFWYIALLSIFSLLLLVCNLDAHPIQVPFSSFSGGILSHFQLVPFHYHYHYKYPASSTSIMAMLLCCLSLWRWRWSLR